MGNIKRFYNMYRKVIWKILGIIIFLIIILQVLNFNAKKSTEESNFEGGFELNSLDNTNQDNTNTDTSITLGSDQSQVTGNKITSSQQDEVAAIQQFYDYLSNNQIEEAYNLITDDCKEQMYKDMETFQRLYKEAFIGTEKKDIVVENWVESVYKITIMDDILSSGTTSGVQLQDHVTVEEIDGEYKLNINNYIGKKEFTKSKTIEGITVDVIERHTYMEYETYTVKIINANEGTIIMDSFSDIESMYIEDGSGVKYGAYTQELIRSDLTIDPNRANIFDIKYYSRYISTKEIKYLVFSDVSISGEQVVVRVEI